MCWRHSLIKDIYSRQHNNYTLLIATVLRCKVKKGYNCFNLTSKDCCYQQRIIVVLTAVYILNLLKHNGMENIKFKVIPLVFFVSFVPSQLTTDRVNWTSFGSFLFTCFGVLWNGDISSGWTEKYSAGGFMMFLACHLLFANWKWNRISSSWISGWSFLVQIWKKWAVSGKYFCRFDPIYKYFSRLCPSVRSSKRNG